MTEKIDAKKFNEGLVELSTSKKDTSGGDKQEISIKESLTKGLEDLSEIQDNQLKL